MLEAYLGFNCFVLAAIVLLYAQEETEIKLGSFSLVWCGCLFALAPVVAIGLGAVAAYIGNKNV